MDARGLLALHLAGGSLLAAGLVAAGAEGEGCCREGNDRNDLGDGGHDNVSPPF